MKIEHNDSNIVCFAADTHIDLADGSRRPIANISVGDAILVYDLLSCKLVQAQVETIASSFHITHVALTLADGTSLSCTDDHPLWVENKGWCVLNPRKAAENYGLTTKRLSKGDRLLALLNGSLKSVKLEDIALIVQPSRMWVVGAGRNHTFFANGVLAHDENINSLDLSEVSSVVVAKSKMQPSEKLTLS